MSDDPSGSATPPAGGDGQAGAGGQEPPQQTPPQGGADSGDSGQTGADSGNPNAGQAPASGTGSGERSYSEADMKQVRDEAAARRTELRTAQQERDQLRQAVEAFQKAIDPNAKGEDDPAKLAEQMQQERDSKDSELKSLRVERQAEKLARTHGADPDALIDSKAFGDKAKKLDTEADDFQEKLDALVKSTVENNPRLRAGQAPARSGSEFNGGSGNGSGAAAPNTPATGDTDAWLKMIRGQGKK